MTLSIRNFFQRSGRFVKTKLSGCWQLKDKKNSPSTINNHSLFDVHTEYSSKRVREREREREKREWERERETDRQTENLQGFMNRRKETPLDLPILSERQLLTDPTASNWQRTTFSKFANFYVSKFRISVGWCHLAKYLRHFTRVPKCLLCF